MLFDPNLFPTLLQESYFNFRGMDYLFYDDKVEFYSLNYHNRKIQSFQELVYTLEVLYWLNRDITEEELIRAALWVSDRSNGKIIRTYGEQRIRSAVIRLFEMDRKPYVNNYRRVVFNPSRSIPKEEKLAIVGTVCGGRKNVVTEEKIYDIVEELMAENEKITINLISRLLGVTRQTVSAHISKSIKEIIKDHNSTL